MTATAPTLLLLCLLWAVYFALHSLLASPMMKRWVDAHLPGLRRSYRLLYNGLAGLFLIPPVWLTLSLEGPWLWRWTGIGFWIGNGLAVAALIGFAHSSRAYEMGEFLGLRQWKEGSKTAQDQGELQLSDWHRYVRHPWYFLGLVVLWTRDMNAAILTSALCITLYLILGSRWEEEKLLLRYGPVYERYRQRVPGLIPRPGRHLSRAEADALLQRTEDRQ